MSLFETLVVAILGLYFLSSLYFGITGRILNHKIRRENRQDREEDLKRADKSLEWEEQLKVLTTRMGEITTENTRLVNVNRDWQLAYDTLLKKYNELRDEFNKIKKEEVEPEKEEEK